MDPALHFKQFGRYEIIRKLGRSMTDVYLALDPESNRRVVLKIVEHAHDSYTQLILEAERRGAAIQKQLHSLDPRILEIYDFGEQNGCFFVAMEYVEGRSLAELLQTEQRLESRRAARYAAEICSQLQTLHSFQADIDGRKRAVVHGDVKPSNIQIDRSDQARLLDFGIAKAITSTHNLTHHSLGSPAYCSPERVKNTNVDQHADLWALGVSLYEMVAGLPPYNAQSTRKLENLIQSRRAPRALPQNCPPSLKAIISKALAADVERRYASAAALEQDLKSFLQNAPTLAETESAPAWDANETIEKKPAARTRPRIRNPKLSRILVEANQILWTVIAGFIVGLLLFIPAGYLYGLWMESASLRGPRNFSHRNLAGIGADWKLYQSLQRQTAFLGRFAPTRSVVQPLHAGFASAGTEIIERYRNGSDPQLQDFDWVKAQTCFKHAIELDPHDNDSRGKLAICNAYAQLVQNPKSAEAVQLAKAGFEEAATYLPRSPDPHLGLARIYIYALHNVGRSLAEFHEAERLGFRPGPREFEQQADGYLYRAEQELRQAQDAATSKADQAHHLLLAQRDLQRARNLYEPISGFSNVAVNLQQLYHDESQQEAIQAREIVKKHSKSRYRRARYRAWR